MAIKQDSTLAEQQSALRKQLLAQRAVIKDTLAASRDNTFPRSKTIRFVTQHSGILKFIFKRAMLAGVVGAFFKRKAARSSRFRRN